MRSPGICAVALVLCCFWAIVLATSPLALRFEAREHAEPEGPGLHRVLSQHGGFCYDWPMQPANSRSSLLKTLIIMWSAVLFISCQSGPLSSTLRVGEQEVAYFSLKTGRQLQSPSAAWDIAFAYEGVIYTNSGTSAAYLGSGGRAAVWYLGQMDIMDFELQQLDLSAFNEEAGADRRAWVQVLHEGEPFGQATEMSLNAFTFLGYKGGSGSEEDPLIDLMEYSGTPYYRYNFASHSIELTGALYLVRHADGKGHSLVQITGREASYPNRTFQFQYRRL